MARRSGSREQILRAELDALSVDLRPALEQVNVPSYILDREGRIRWLNEAARSVVGNVVGRDFMQLVAPEDADRAREMFAKKLFGAARTDFPLTVLGRGGRRIPAEISSVPLEEMGHVVGVFGLGRLREPAERPAPPPHVRLTPRQHDVLVLLGEGASTEQIAAMLGIARETVRNHIRAILRELGVHSRIAAIAQARRFGLL
jgi:PAS domain S-box-containing protein